MLGSTPREFNTSAAHFNDGSFLGDGLSAIWLDVLTMNLGDAIPSGFNVLFQG